jgi:hypothetical protein
MKSGLVAIITIGSWTNPGQRTALDRWWCELPSFKIPTPACTGVKNLKFQQFSDAPSPSSVLRTKSGCPKNKKAETS